MVRARKPTAFVSQCVVEVLLAAPPAHCCGDTLQAVASERIIISITPLDVAIQFVIATPGITC